MLVLLAILKSGAIIPILDERGECRQWNEIRVARDWMDDNHEEYCKTHDLERWYTVGIRAAP